MSLLSKDSVQQTTDSKRVVWIDSLRAVMIFAIALGHALGAGLTHSGVLFNYVYSFHVPAFFLVSGFLFSYKETSFWTFTVNKIKKLLVPYYIFSVISILIFQVLGSVASSALDVSVKSNSLLKNIFGMLYGNAATGYMKWNQPLWFLPCLFVMSILFYLVLKAASALNKNQDKIIIVTFFVMIALSFLNYYIFKIGTLPFGLETAVYMFPFFIAGYYIKRNNILEKINSKYRFVIGVLCLCLGAVLGLISEIGVSYVANYYGNMMLFYICAFASIIGYILVLQNLKCKWLEYTGKNTLAILVMHKFPIVFLQMLFVSQMESSRLLSAVIAVLITAISCALCLGVSEIIKRIFPLALGMDRKTK